MTPVGGVAHRSSRVINKPGVLHLYAWCKYRARVLQSKTLKTRFVDHSGCGKEAQKHGNLPNPMVVQPWKKHRPRAHPRPCFCNFSFLLLLLLLLLLFLVCGAGSCGARGKILFLGNRATLAHCGFHCPQHLLRPFFRASLLFKSSCLCSRSGCSFDGCRETPGTAIGTAHKRQKKLHARQKPKVPSKAATNTQDEGHWRSICWWRLQLKAIFFGGGQTTKRQRHTDTDTDSCRIPIQRLLVNLGVQVPNINCGLHPHDLVTRPSIPGDSSCLYMTGTSVHLS